MCTFWLDADYLLGVERDFDKEKKSMASFGDVAES